MSDGRIVDYFCNIFTPVGLKKIFMDNPDVPFKDQKRGVYWLDESKGELNAILYTDARITSVAPLKSSYPSRSQWLVEGREFQAHGLTFRLIRGQPPAARRQPGTSRYDWHWQPEQFLCEYPPGAWQEISREWEALVGERLERP